MVSESPTQHTEQEFAREVELTGNRTSRVVKPVILTIVTEVQ